ncbi:hypothetical protein BA059_16825 [Mycolicibacterium sp. (ex Dasyatis americana)]|nr:hypothetical protein BA059_16825 [Mycolicibacterium sp. (ex Dasyatis americana)]
MCFMHAMLISRAYDELLDAHTNPKPLPRDPFVYYLMVGPETVKIGTTKDLNRRLCGLRTEAQYVVAIERGSFEVETERHRQFADERIGRREDFRLSDRLKAHIEAMQPDRDRLVEIATTATRKSGAIRKNGEFVAP